MNNGQTVHVSAIVVNWNGREHLEVCLESLLNQTLPGVEVILVDNGSTDGSVEFVQERFNGAIHIISHSSNLGYGRALNTGIMTARGRYLFALNNDTEVHPLCLEALVNAADHHTHAGSFAPKILSYSDRTVIDNVGHLLYPDGLSRGRGRLEEDRGQYDVDEEILLPSGCAVLLRRAMLADVGLFDEDLFAYCEDTDLGLRARLAGWRCRYVPAAMVYHKYSASTGDYSALKAFLVERNRAWVAIKCLPAPLLIVSPVLTMFRLGMQAWGAMRRQGAAGRFAAANSIRELLTVFGSASSAAARGFPVAWRKRRTVQRQRRVSTFDAVLWIVRHGMGLRQVALKD